MTQPQHTEEPKFVGNLTLLEDPRVNPTVCQDCKVSIGEPPTRPWPFARFCEGCEAKRKADFEAAQPQCKDLWTDQWDGEDCEEAICPKLYRDTCIDHPGFNRTAWGEASKWQFGQEGITLFGDSRKCKTRIMFLLLKREYLENKRSVQVIFGDELRDMAKKAVSQGNESKVSAMLAKPDVLALDDPFLAGATDERVTAFILSVVDARVRRMKPIFATSQVGGEDLKQSAGRFGTLNESDKSRLEAIFNRLREVNKLVKCK